MSDAVPEPSQEVAVDPEHDPAAPAPLKVPRTPTGDAEVDARLERLGDADHLATDGHMEVYEDVHRGLRDALTALDARPGPPAPSPSYDQRAPSLSYGTRS
ncbi:hypothetical protein [Streptomyces sp. SLBN-8D4]|uniref:hypothetical protein n=1 Tax=Streptomyces sp. SLBN-8D4 TaxID=3377728 RepID=UPI003C7DF902